MDLFGRAELGLLGGGEGLTEDMSVPGIGWSSSGLHDDVYPASGLALAAAYHDIKTRLASLERENSSIKRKLQHYEVKFPVIREFGEEQLLCCSCEPFINDISTIQAKTTNLQQKINSLTQELQKSKEREERLEEVIQAYEKIHLEKSKVQRDLDNMTSLAEQHMERISCLESALKQRDCSLEKLSAQLRSNEWRPGAPPTLDVPREGRGPSLQSSRSLDALSDLKLQRLEVELEGARHQAEGACQREEGLRAELSRLQQELVQLQEIQRQCDHCDVEWIKKAGDEQVNLALAYTELTEELGRVHSLTEKQCDLLQKISQDSVPCSPTAPQHLSPTSPQRPSRSPDRLHPPPSPPLSPSNGPASYTHQPISSRLRAKFRSHRSYSEVTDPSAIQRLPAFLVRDPVSTLPKSRPVLGGAPGAYSKSKLQVHTSLVGPIRPASAHGLGSDRGGSGGSGGGSGGSGGGSLSCSPLQRTVSRSFPLTEVHHFRQRDDGPEPTPLVTPPQSSEDEEDDCQYVLSTASPPRTLGAIGIGSSPPREPSFPAPRKQAQHPSLSAPEAAATLSRHLPPYIHSEHAQSWPSINLWMESEESAARSCPLCQLTFPTGYPDDALIKHIDSHLENSKI